ncbi:GntR family transcriptional regulator [Paenibacillus sp. sptzw28]|uniref:GntR family transcriptional regulator n=1 Tax=Paenibacillus sp. sptzw28 TaxID=715179 RepID=UPI001C6EAF1D|nr:GntR family transcriptional regulator [Paenibacillus sp. sptzw28]QYR21195.1 GntR family transcriptional regulator [Paenibacillus sp. sptzw28]
MFIELDLQSDVPIYTQIAEQLVEGIASGELKPGEALPSVRSLASDLNINLHTVNKAYQSLKQEGFLQVHRKQGVVVQPAGMPDVTAAFLGKLRRQLRPLAAEAIVRGMSEAEFTEICLAVYRRDYTEEGELHQ